MFTLPTKPVCIALIIVNGGIFLEIILGIEVITPYTKGCVQKYCTAMFNTECIWGILGLMWASNYSIKKPPKRNELCSLIQLQGKARLQ